MADKVTISGKAISAKMMSEVLHAKNPIKYPEDYITEENYDTKITEMVDVFTKEESD